MRHLNFLFVFLCAFSSCRTEISLEEKDRLLNGFIEFLNNLPNHQDGYEDGTLLNAQETEENYFRIEAKLKEKDSLKYVRCTSTLSLQENGVSILDNSYSCDAFALEAEVTPAAVEATDGVSEGTPTPVLPVDHKPVELDNEVRPYTEATSGEQFVAIPREEPIRRDSVPCIGCGSHVDPQAPGVSDLAAIGVRQLDRHEPNVKHSLNRVIDVLRQVQVVNGVRYVLTVLVDYNNCTLPEDQACTFTETCKISILEKPWIKLPSGGKYRAVVSNNCTDTWLFGDNGEVIPDGLYDIHKDINPSDNDDKTDDSYKPTPDYDKIANTGSADEILKAIQNKDLQSQQTQKVLSDDEIKNLEDQIIPYSQFQTSTDTFVPETVSSNDADVSKHNVDVETAKLYSDNSNSANQEASFVSILSDEKKKTIDDLMNFFDFAGFSPPKDKRETSRNKRSYENDIKVMSLVNRFHTVKKSVTNAKYIYKVAHTMVDYLNEIYSDKNRILQEVITAEEESDTDLNYVYLKARVALSNNEANIDELTEICSGVIDATHKDNPVVLTAFCHKDVDKNPNYNTPVKLEFDDKVLQVLIKKALKKLESESPKDNAMIVTNIISASTQRGIGTLTKVSVKLSFSSCSKTAPVPERVGCVLLQELGSKVCDIQFFERAWLKDTQITYHCIDTTVDESFSNVNQIATTFDRINDPKVIEMTQEALSNLETQSNRNNRQKIVGIKSVSTQLVAGLLTTIEFLTGYTKCKSNTQEVIANCDLLVNERLRLCTAKIWHRPWLEDGKDMKVTCDDNYKVDKKDLQKYSNKQKLERDDRLQNPSDWRYDFELAKESLEKYMQETGMTHKYEVVSVDKSSVLSKDGISYKLDFAIKSLVNPASTDEMKCHSDIWVPSHDEKKIDVNCNIQDDKSRQKRGIPGGIDKKDPNDPQYKVLAEESMAKYLQTSGETKPHRVVSVDEVTYQVVSGSLTSLTFTIKPEGEGDVIKCQSKVWEQSWINKKEIDVNCNIDLKSRQKRGFAGGISKKDPNDPQYKVLAEESMAKYLQTSGETKSHRVVSVDEVTYQTVSGSLTRLNFTIKPEGEGDIIKCHSEVWEQPWLNKKEIDVNCDIQDSKSRRKRGIPGGIDKKDPNDPQYKVLAEESMAKYLQTSGETKPHRVVSVDEVTYQVVSGSLTSLTFTIKPEGEGDVIKCQSKVWEQSWINKKEIDVNCNIDLKSRQKRGFAGGISKKDPNDPQYKVLAEESMAKYLQTSGETKSHRVVSVDEVTYQTVSGSLTRLNFTIKPEGEGDIIKCHSEVWEQPWLNKKEIDVNCDIQDSKSRRKRGIPGGIDKKDPNDPQYKVLAEESMAKYLQTSGETKPHRVVSVDEVTYQVVSGSLTRLTFTIKPEGEGDVIICQSKVWEQSWLNKKEIDVNCIIQDSKSRQKRGIPGGIDKKDPNDPQYKLLAEESMAKYLQTSGETKPHRVVSVDEVTHQVVSGSLTRLTFTIKPEGEGDVIKCQSKVWEQSWLNKKEIDVNCNIQDSKSRQKRGIRGGINKKDPNDPQYKVLAEESMAKYLQASGESKLHRVVSVDEVTYQTVSGSLTRLNFTIKPEGEGDVIKCHSEVWEQPWLNKKEIDVNCNIQDSISRQKRSFAGGISEKDPNDPQYKLLAEESMAKYLQTSGETKPHRVVSVDEVTYQTVSGSLTRLTFTIEPEGEGDVIKCQSKVWEQPWLNKKEIDVNCNIQDDKSRQKRGIPGGIDKKDPNDPQYKLLAEESMAKYLQTSGETKPHRVVSVDEVTHQVVSGSLTSLTFTIKPESEGDVIKCQSKVWEQPWLNKKEIDVNCNIRDSKSRQERQIPGGIRNDLTFVGGPLEKNASDPKYKLLAEEAMQQYLQMSKVTQAHRVFTVDKVTVQVVSGIKTRVNFTITPDIESDKVDVIKCYSKIWEIPWLQKKDITVSCTLAPSRAKRAVMNKNKHSGGLVEQDPSDREYLMLAKDSLHKYQHLHRSKSEHVVLEVKKVTTQIVAGKMYRINFVAKRTSCEPADIKHSLCTEANENNMLFCFSKIWDRPWLKQKKIDVSCYADDVNDDDDDHTVAPNSFEIGVKEEKDANDKEYNKLAKLALKKYKKISKSKYGYKINKIYHVTQQIAAGISTNIDFAAIQDCSDVDCPETKVVLHCQTELWQRPGPKVTPDVMSIVCKQKKKAEVSMQNVLQRAKRQIELEDNDIEEEMKYYYGDLALQNLNEHSDTDNLYKMVTIHAMQKSTQMQNTLVRMYIEVAATFCLKHQDEGTLGQCDEMDGIYHKLCHARLYPSSDDEMIVRHVVVICDDDVNFSSVTGLAIPSLLKESIEHIESDPEISHKMVNVGRPYVIPSLDSRVPIKINFMVAPTNCSKDVDVDNYRGEICFVDPVIPSKTCNAYIFMEPHSETIRNLDVQCYKPQQTRTKRWISMNGNNVTADEIEVRKLAELALSKLEMESLHRYKQKILEINNYSTRITSGRETSIDFEVGYTSCIKYEYVENLESCQLLEHLPRRQCTAKISETLWIKNGQKIDVSCKDDETPLEAHVEFLSAQTAAQLSEEALRHVEAKYPHPRKQKVVRVFSLEKQAIAGMHYRMKMEVGLTNCSALSNSQDCEVVTDAGLNKFCRVNVWIRPWTDHTTIFRVSCDYQNDDYKFMYEDIQAQHLFFEFLQTHKPDYMNDEKALGERFKIFRDNVKKMHQLNVRERGTATYGVTRFADLTYEEFSSKYLGLKPSLKNENNIPMSKAKIPNTELPTAFDWRDHGAVTEVKDQGSCGSCWAFSVTGNIEGQWKLSSGNLVSLSEQELVDCDKLDDGCNGGLPDNAYRAIEQLGGLELENDYPYEGEDDKCSFNKTMAKVKISGAVNITTNETDMAKWLTQHGPISIGINANAMQFYMGGVSHPWKMLCSPKNLDHGVLIVGFGVKDYPLFKKHLPYWTIKNSWGKSWGEQGYYRVYRGDGTCGVNQMASSAVV